MIFNKYLHIMANGYYIVWFIINAVSIYILILLYALVFEIIVIVGDKLPYLGRNELLESLFRCLLHGLSLMIFCRVSLACALGRAPLFCFLLFKQKTHNISTLPILTLNIFFRLYIFHMIQKFDCIVKVNRIVRLDKA